MKTLGCPFLLQRNYVLSYPLIRYLASLAAWKKHSAPALAKSQRSENAFVPSYLCSLAVQHHFEPNTGDPFIIGLFVTPRGSSITKSTPSLHRGWSLYGGRRTYRTSAYWSGLYVSTQSLMKNLASFYVHANTLDKEDREKREENQRGKDRSYHYEGGVHTLYKRKGKKKKKKKKSLHGPSSEHHSTHPPYSSLWRHSTSISGIFWDSAPWLASPLCCPSNFFGQLPVSGVRRPQTWRWNLLRAPLNLCRRGVASLFTTCSMSLRYDC